MNEPLFLTLEKVLELQRRSIDTYGGLHGIRDKGLLESALAMPQAGFGGEYAHSTVFEMGAAYLFHLTKNHPFLDGNKRIGFAAAVVFLHMNGYRYEDTQKAAEAMVLKAATGQSDKPDIAAYLRSHCKPLEEIDG
jgi:death on curing protein